MLKLIVFDCDGVLFDSREANRSYYNDLLAAFGCGPMTEDQLHYAHCHNVSDSVACIFKAHPHVDLKAVHRHRENLDYTPYLSSMVMEPDLVGFLEIVKEHFHLAISTNRTTTMAPLLETFGLTGYFELVVTSIDVAMPKPAPDALFKIFDHFRCAPGQTIFIGDSEVDRQHTVNAGVDLIAFRNRQLDARYHVESFMEILDLAPFAQVRP